MRHDGDSTMPWARKEASGLQKKVTRHETVGPSGMTEIEFTGYEQA